MIDDPLFLLAATWGALALAVVARRAWDRWRDYRFEQMLAEAPHYCPGCQRVGDVSCAPGCIDAEIEQETRDSEWRRHDDYAWADDDRAWNDEHDDEANA